MSYTDERRRSAAVCPDCPVYPELTPIGSPLPAAPERTELSERLSPKGNPAQNEAIRHADGPCLVLAGPGSGKTFVLTERLCFLITTLHISPSSILVLTFSKAAAAEMRQRFQRRTASQYPAVTFGTFHSVFYRILQDESAEKLRLIDGERQLRLLRRLWEDYAPRQERLRPDNLCLDDPQWTSGGWTADVPRQHTSGRADSAASLVSGRGALVSAPLSREALSALAGAISAWKNGARPHSAQATSFSKIACAYERYLQENSLLDFDDMILRCEALFRERPEILARWQARFSYLLIDEFQDINEAQYRIVRLLAGERANLFAVGDDDQAIYGFRGSSPAIMRRFPENYPACRKILLQVNYRCGREILRAAMKLISRNKERFPKKIVANRKDSFPVRSLSFATEQEEYGWLCAEIAALPLKERRQTAVIFRGHAQARAFAQVLRTAGLCGNGEGTPNGRDGDPMREELRRTLAAYLRFAMELTAGATGSAAGTGRGRRADFYRIMNCPERFLSRGLAQTERVSRADLLSAAVGRPQTMAALTALLDDCRLLATLRPRHALRYLRRAVGLESHFAQPALWEEFEKVSAELPTLERFLAYLEEADICAAADRETSHTKEVGQRSTSVSSGRESVSAQAAGWRRASFPAGSASSAPVGASAQPDNAAAKEESAPRILTMHASKGLEFTRVYLPDLNEGILPSRRAVTAEALEEERRLLYVAMTRAKERLTLLYLSGTKENPRPASRFLSEIFQGNFQA
ncbi:MAG: ATP-dependent helicase [Eubacteriales bacterium]|nr:ATP-dependent helicase [Eubacteriales bacterium]